AHVSFTPARVRNLGIRRDGCVHAQRQERHCTAHGFQKLVALERLLEERDSAGAQALMPSVPVTMARENDHRMMRPRSLEMPQQREPPHSRHSKVENKAARAESVIGLEERLRRFE